MVQKNEDSSLKVLSATALVVAEYELNVLAPASIKEGKNLDINMGLEGAPKNGNYTYGAVLVNGQAYRANIEVDSNGTKNSTSLMINGVDFINKFDINSSNYKSKLTKNELQKEIQTLIGGGNGSIAIGEVGQKKLSLTTFDLPPGHYYLFVGAYDPKKKIAGLTQLGIDIESNGNKDNNNDNNNNNNINNNSNNTNNNDNNSNNNNNTNNNDNNNNNNNYNNNNNNTTNYNNNSDNSGNGGSGSDYENDNIGGSSGNGGRSGSVVSPESAKNIKSKELSQQFISNGRVIRFEFPKDATPVVYVEFKAKKTVGDTTTTVEELKEKSILTPNEPTGEIYKHINIWVGSSGFANSNNIENATVGFKVRKDWINGNQIKVDSLVLQHFRDKKWDSLPTRKVNEDNEYIYFEAKTPTFSPFAISAEKLVVGDNEENSQAPSEVTPEDKTGATTRTGNITQGNKNEGIPKIASFFIGLLVILLAGAIISKKKGPEK